MFECFDGLRVGLAVTGSFCTHRNIAAVADNLVKRGAVVYPILSYSSSETSTRFMTREELYDTLVRITGHEPICTIKEAEPIRSKKAARYCGRRALHRQYDLKAGKCDHRYAGIDGM